MESMHRGQSQNSINYLQLADLRICCWLNVIGQCCAQERSKNLAKGQCREHEKKEAARLRKMDRHVNPPRQNLNNNALHSGSRLGTHHTEAIRENSATETTNTQLAPVAEPLQGCASTSTLTSTATSSLPIQGTSSNPPPPPPMHQSFLSPNLRALYTGRALAQAAADASEQHVASWSRNINVAVWFEVSKKIDSRCGMNCIN